MIFSQGVNVNMLLDKELTKCLDIAVEAAMEAGMLVKECVEKVKQMDSVEKGCETDLVTEYDKKVEVLIMGKLEKEFPGWGMVGEESYDGKGMGVGPTWVVDPIDGTLSFMHKSFDCCICIGLAVDKKAVLGVIYAPLLDELYTAVVGRGAHCNGRRIHTSSITSLNKALLSTHFPSYTRDPAFTENLFSIWRDLLRHPVQGFRAYGSCGLDLCSIAKGRLDAYFEAGIWAWDVCAGSIILLEAGGVLLDITGGPFDMENRRMLAAATPELAEELLRYLKKFDVKAAKL
eukprot:TRINITY_DN7382_c0_g1_i1.p1 TRINITY_DN7382_c0_g1~~TRINITY_DN7382_c0_g1_i1.p1  ORF type:complete len:289 (+),score=46.93 TRINITY_DN7382_c0_g1_i1:66-932(+)